MDRSDAAMEQTDATHCTAARQHALPSKATAHDLYSQRYPLYVSSSALLRPASTGGEHAVHAVCRVRYSCVRACLAARTSKAYQGHQSSAATTKRASPRSSSIISASLGVVSARFLCTPNARGNLQHCNCKHILHIGPSVGTGGDPCAVLSECACGKRDVRSRHMARGFARDLLSFSEKQTGMTMNRLSGCRCNASRTRTASSHHRVRIIRPAF